MEQSSGAGQINNAIQQLNTVTQRNAASAEEMATSAEELSAQADQLKIAMNYFQIDGEKSSAKSITLKSSIKEDSKIETKSRDRSKRKVELEMIPQADADANFESF